MSPRPFCLERPPEPLTSFFSAQDMSRLEEGLDKFRKSECAAGKAHCAPFFMILRPEADAASPELTVLPLSELGRLDDAALERILFGFVDPCSLAGNPGWPLRNLLIFLSARKLSRATIVCFRGRMKRIDLLNPHVHVLLLPSEDDDGRTCVCVCVCPGGVATCVVG